MTNYSVSGIKVTCLAVAFVVHFFYSNNYCQLMAYPLIEINNKEDNL